jgi:hypothetical protein
VPETTRAERRAAGREAARRRQAEAALRLAASMAMYAAGQLANGLAPEQARRAAMEAAGELETVAVTVGRPLTWAKAVTLAVWAGGPLSSHRRNHLNALLPIHSPAGVARKCFGR